MIFHAVKTSCKHDTQNRDVESEKNDTEHKKVDLKNGRDRNVKIERVTLKNLPCGDYDRRKVIIIYR